MAAMTYMLTAIMLASVLVVIMLGVASMHGSLNNVQAEIAEQSRSMKSVHMARVDALAAQVQRWSASSQNRTEVQEIVRTMLSASKTELNAKIQQVADSLVTFKDDMKGELEEQIHDRLQDQFQALKDLSQRVGNIDHDHENILQEITAVHERLDAIEKAREAAKVPALSDAAATGEEGFSESSGEAQQQDMAQESFGGMRDLLRRSRGARTGAQEEKLLAAPSIWPESPVGVSPLSSERRRVAWFRECGCTGMEIESVLVLSGLAEVVGVDSIRTNLCVDTCAWSASTRSLLDRIEVEEYSLLRADGNVQENYTLVLVVHAGYLGVCGFPDKGDLLEHPGILRVSRSMFETDRLDNYSVELCNSGRFDAIWVPSEFNRRTFTKSGVDEAVVKVLPEAVDTTLYNCSDGPVPRRSRSTPWLANANTGSIVLDRLLEAPVDGSTFTFLSVFKWEQRKNWMGLLSAFAKAFPESAYELPQANGSVANITVQLLIKTQALSWGTPPSWDLQAFFDDVGPTAAEALRPRIMVVTDRIKAELMPLVFRAVDAFVLPTYGEGWGLPLIEAMATGLPTIATGWGGQTQFMDDTNSFLVDYRMVPTMDSNHPSHMWAEANQTDLEHAMLEVASRSHESFAKAKAACDVTTKFTINAMASLAAGLIEDISSADPAPAPAPTPQRETDAEAQKTETADSAADAAEAVEVPETAEEAFHVDPVLDAQQERSGEGEAPAAAGANDGIGDSPRDL